MCGLSFKSREITIVKSNALNKFKAIVKVNANVIHKVIKALDDMKTIIHNSNIGKNLFVIA